MKKSPTTPTTRLIRATFGTRKIIFTTATLPLLLTDPEVTEIMDMETGAILYDTEWRDDALIAEILETLT